MVVISCQYSSVEYRGGRLSTVNRRAQQLLIPFFLWSLLKLFSLKVFSLNVFFLHFIS